MKFQLESVKTIYNWLDGKKRPMRRKLDKFLSEFGFATEAELYGEKPTIPDVEQVPPDVSYEMTARGVALWSDQDLSELTYHRYRDLQVWQIESAEVISHLESRYKCQAFTLGGRKYPASVIWKNTHDAIWPDAVLGELDQRVPEPLRETRVLKPAEYGEARRYIKRMYEAPPSPITAEGLNYRMTRIELKDIPKIHGAFGWYYDNILTQYAMEWELKRALLRGGASATDELFNRGILPLRESVESHGNPLTSGGSRCASITVSTLLVFKRRNHGYYCLIRRRSRNVGVSPGMLHVVPAGMFEAKNSLDRWSIALNVWRELLEEVYGEEEQQHTGDAEFPDYMLRKQPIPLLEEMLKDGSAELSVTGICCDLLNLRPEVCTVLFVRDSRFLEERRMRLNWEFEPEGPAGTFAVPWKGIDVTIESLVETGGVVSSGAVCLGLGIDWVRVRGDA